MATIIATWSPPVYAALKDFLVTLTAPGSPTLVDSQTIARGTNRYESPTVTSGIIYTVTLRVRSLLGIVSLPVSVTVLAIGSTLARGVFTTPTLANMEALYDYATGLPYWVTSMGQTFNSLFGSALNTYSSPLFTYHTSGTSTLTTEEFDAGATYNNAWAGAVTEVNVGGTSIQYLELRTLSTDAWVRHTGGSFIGSARRARLSSETLTTATQRVNNLGDVVVTA